MLKKPWTTQQPMTQAVTWGPTMTVLMMMMGKTLREAQHPINSTVMPRHSCDRTVECAEHVQGRSDRAGGQRDGGIQTGHIGD